MSQRPRPPRHSGWFPPGPDRPGRRAPAIAAPREAGGRARASATPDSGPGTETPPAEAPPPPSQHWHVAIRVGPPGPPPMRHPQTRATRALIRRAAAPGRAGSPPPPGPEPAARAAAVAASAAPASRPVSHAPRSRPRSGSSGMVCGARRHLRGETLRRERCTGGVPVGLQASGGGRSAGAIQVTVGGLGAMTTAGRRGREASKSVRLSPHCKRTDERPPLPQLHHAPSRAWKVTPTPPASRTSDRCPSGHTRAPPLRVERGGSVRPHGPHSESVRGRPMGPPGGVYSDGGAGSRRCDPALKPHTHTSSPQTHSQPSAQPRKLTHSRA